MGALWMAALLAVAVVVCVCTPVSGQTELGCITNYDPDTNYFGYLTSNVTDQPFVLPINITIVDTANDFSVSYGKSYKVARNSLRQTNYILYQCGSPSPNKLQLGVDNGTRSFQIPTTNFTIDSNVPVAYLELLGALSGLRAISADGNYVASPCVVKYENEGRVISINGTDSSVTDEYNSVFISPASNAAPDNRTNVVLFDATLDPGPLKRAEWIKFLATYLNLEERANNVFESIRTTYQCFNGSQNKAATKPNVAWLSYYGGTWTISNATYKLQLDLDAGGVNPPYTKLSYNMSLSADVDAFHKILGALNVILDDSYADSPPDYTFADFCKNANISIGDTSYPFVASKSVWRNDKRIGRNLGLDWFEGAVAQPQIVLHDLLGIFHPSLNYGTPVYFRNIALDEGVLMTATEECSHTIEKAMDPTVYACPLSANGKNGAVATMGVPSILRLLIALGLVLCVSL